MDPKVIELKSTQYSAIQARLPIGKRGIGCF